MEVVEVVKRGGKYKIVKVDESTGKRAYDGVIRLVKVRNPWGKTDFKGKWGKDSKEMRIAKDVLDYKSMDNGVFYMELDDFYKYFA